MFDLTALQWLIAPAPLLVLGLLIGSFLNVVIHRMPLMLERGWLGDIADFLQDRKTLDRVLGDQAVKRLGDPAGQGQRLAAELAQLPRLGLSKPRSRCPHCGHQITWHENIPLLSWLMLKGRCSACKAPISVRYPLIELLTGLLFGAVAWRFGASAATIVYCTATAVMVAAAFIDLDTTLLPDNLTLPLIALGLIAAWLKWTPVSLPDAALGAVFGYLSLWSVSTVYGLIKGQVGMAEGDFKLLAGLGALLGWQALLPIILMSSVVGAAIGIFLIVAKGHNREVPIPFGPYLAGGGMVVILMGHQAVMSLINI
ncbi:prepilin peptidase [Ideonella sp.]|jgi:leader peptidase (prepilin peptidase)/N-methyltransferase|uniref:prepilin peptidase n=1 Tax=Ideonella sp. TaxID=1929293 RepID=UPI0037BF9B41